MTFSPCLLSPIIPGTFITPRDTFLSYGDLLKDTYYLAVPSYRDPELPDTEKYGSFNKYCTEEG